MFEEAKKLAKEMLNDDEFFEINAQMTKKMVDAYTKAGFTREEALTLVCNKGNGFNYNMSE